MNKLKQLEACGQSPWLDYLKRSLIEKGELRTLIERDGLKGVTSNPSIFEKAIGETDEYADALKQFQAQADHSISAIYEHLAIADIRAGADMLRPVYEETTVVTATSAWNARLIWLTIPKRQWPRHCGCGRRWSVRT